MIRIAVLESLIAKELHGALSLSDPISSFPMPRKTSKRISGRKRCLMGPRLSGDGEPPQVPRAHLTPERDFSTPKATSSESSWHQIHNHYIYIHALTQANMCPFPKVLMFPQATTPVYTFPHMHTCASSHKTRFMSHTFIPYAHIYKHA